MCRWNCQLNGRDEASILCLPRVTPNLRNQKIHTKGCILVFQKSLELGNLFTQHIRRVADAPDDAETAGIGDRCCEFWTGGYVHTSEHDWVVDFEEVGDRGSKLFWEDYQYQICGGGEGGKHPRFDLRGEAILCRRCVTDGRESLDFSRMKQDLLCGKKERNGAR